MKRGAAAVVLALACAATPVARAESASEVRAQALFEEGKALRALGRYPAACADFEESRRLADGIGVTLYLADCYEHTGELRRARTEFRRAQRLAVTRGDRRAEVARRRADAIDPLAPPKGAVSNAAPTPGPAPPAPASVPPIRASTERMPPGGAGPVPPGAAPTPSGALGPVPRYVGTRRGIGIGVAGTGVAGIGIGAVFGAVAISRLSRSNGGPCSPDDHCTSAGLALRQQSADAATVSTIAFAAGAAALAAGLTIYLTAPPGREPVTLTPMAGAGGAGAVLEGRF